MIPLFEVSELKGAHLCSKGGINLDDDAKSLHFLIDADKKEPVGIPSEQPEEAAVIAGQASVDAGGEEEELEVFKPDEQPIDFGTAWPELSECSNSSVQADIEERLETLGIA